MDKYREGAPSVPRVGRWSAGGRIVLQRVEALTTLAERTRGLLGRAGLPAGHAVWLCPCSAIHTLGMHFTIDLLFLDAARRIVRIVREVEPWRMAWGGADAESVLEMQSGWLGQDQVSVGDQFSVSC
jgi:uncharacterized membrane protein (UPF0127 family)